MHYNFKTITSLNIIKQFSVNEYRIIIASFNNEFNSWQTLQQIGAMLDNVVWLFFNHAKKSLLSMIKRYLSPQDANDKVIVNNHRENIVSYIERIK